MPRLPVELSHYNPVIEGMSREELLRLQWKRLKQQLEYVYHTSPYYRRVMQQARVTPEDIKNREDFAARIPLTTKKGMLEDQQGVPPYGDRLGVPEGKVMRPWLTSGTSGQGQEVYGLTRLDTERSLAMVMGAHWAGFRRGEVMANTFPLSSGNLAGADHWIRVFDKAGATLLHLGATFTIEQKLERMQRFSPHLLLAVSAYLSRLRVACEEAGIQPKRDLPRLKSVITGVAAWNVDWVQDMEEFWDARLFDMYACSQARNTIALTCEQGAVVVGGRRGVLHMLENILYVEVLERETRKPVTPGEEGELVVTPLGVEGSPLLRFATSDRVRYLPHTACRCGRPLAGLEAGSITRFDDMLKVRMLNIWPQAVDEVVLAHDEVGEYIGRVWMSELGQEEITLTLEFKGPVPVDRKQSLLKQLSTELKEKVGLNMRLEEAREPLPRFQYKSARWKDERLESRRGLGF